MMKRSIKAAAGVSKISTQQATSAARVVYRDSSTGRLVIVDPTQSGYGSGKTEKRGPAVSRAPSKKR